MQGDSVVRGLVWKFWAKKLHLESRVLFPERRQIII